MASRADWRGSASPATRSASTTSFPGSWSCSRSSSGSSPRTRAYRLDDAVPRLWRARSRAQREADELRGGKAEYCRLVDQVFDRILQEQARLLSDVKSNIEYYQQLISRSVDERRTFVHDAAEMQDACNIVLKRYRQTNARVRQSPAPFYFNNSFTFDGRLVAAARGHLGRARSDCRNPTRAPSRTSAISPGRTTRRSRTCGPPRSGAATTISTSSSATSGKSSFARPGKSRADAVPLSHLDRRGIWILSGIGAFAVVLLATVVGVTWSRPIIGARQLCLPGQAIPQSSARRSDRDPGRPVGGLDRDSSAIRAEFHQGLRRRRLEIQPCARASRCSPFSKATFESRTARG